ncbi:MAG: hypothetical protein V4727_03460 [Verrucomicrobiota bacterium]
MSAISRKLVVEVISCREFACKISGTKNDLRLFAEDLIKAIEQTPDMDKDSTVNLTGWEQHTFDNYDEGFYFSVQPDIESYIAEKEQKRISEKKSEIWVILLIIVFLAISLIGFGTVISWLFS